MKKNIVIGFLIMLAGLIAGLYIGVYLGIFSGIISLITQAVLIAEGGSAAINAGAIAWGLVRVIFGGAVGYVCGILIAIPGYVTMMSK